MDLVVYDDDDKRYVPWAVALAAMLLVALVAAVLTFTLARRASGETQPRTQPISGVSSPQPGTAPSSGAAPTPVGPAPSAAVCLTALERADAALERALAVEKALAQHTAIADELLAARITAQQALDRTLPVLTDGATERRRFEEAMSAYRVSREDCRS